MKEMEAATQSKAQCGSEGGAGIRKSTAREREKKQCLMMAVQTEQSRLDLT